MAINQNSDSAGMGAGAPQPGRFGVTTEGLQERADRERKLRQFYEYNTTGLGGTLLTNNSTVAASQRQAEEFKRLGITPQTIENFLGPYQIMASREATALDRANPYDPNVAMQSRAGALAAQNAVLSRANGPSLAGMQGDMARGNMQMQAARAMANSRNPMASLSGLGGALSGAAGDVAGAALQERMAALNQYGSGLNATQGLSMQNLSNSMEQAQRMRALDDARRQAGLDVGTSLYNSGQDFKQGLAQLFQRASTDQSNSWKKGVWDNFNTGMKAVGTAAAVAA